MHIFVSAHELNGGRTVVVTLQGTDEDLTDFIDEGSSLDGMLGNLTALVADRTGLVAERVDERAVAARLLRRAAAILDREPGA